MDLNYSLPWVEKYRPKNIEEIISHTQNIDTIKKLLENESLPHLLFHGSPGTGKTSMILAIAKKIYGKNMRLMVMKLDASDDRGINSVREDIKGFAEKSNMFIKGIRMIILDEADSMTFDAQFALRRIIEKYSSIIRFCLICNYENKIIPAIRSRCTNFRFNNIDNKSIKLKLNEICLNEKLSYDNNVIDSISYISQGDLRKAINLLQCISMQSNHLTSKLCYDNTGIPDNKNINFIVNILYDKTKNFDTSYNIIKNIIENNYYELSIVFKELILIIINNNDLLIKSAIFIYELSKLEYMISKTTYNIIYISYFVGIFKKSNNLLLDDLIFNI
jgi:replication factor C subunit 3/5